MLIIVLFVLGIVATGIWVLLIQGLRGWFGATGELAATLEGFSSAAAFGFTIAGGIIILIQINQAMETRGIETFNATFERMMSDEHISARRWIYLHLPQDVEAGLTLLDQDEKAKSDVKRVLNSFDHLGFLLMHDWIAGESETRIIQWMSPFVVKTWDHLGPYIEHERARRNEPDYYIAAEFLAKQCHKWRDKHLPGDKYKQVDRAL
jgi:hypothetical protein